MPEFSERRTGASRVIDGVNFEQWQTDHLQHEWRSEDGRIMVQANRGARRTWTSLLDGQIVGRRFYDINTAAAAAVQAMREKDAAE